MAGYSARTDVLKPVATMGTTSWFEARRRTVAHAALINQPSGN
jgi:hypothetical protein